MRRPLRRATGAGLVAVAVALLGGCAPPRPNFLLVTLDTTRADAIGAWSGRAGVTPHLDALAGEAVRFDRAYSVTPLTIPAHSSIMTGLYPPRHGVRDNGDYFLGDDADTLAERLAGSGYRTAAAVAAEVTSHHWGFAQGFDAFFDDMGATQRDRWRVSRPGGAVVDDALGWLGGQPADAPWFLWVHLFDAHAPYEPPEPYAARFPGDPYRGEVAYADSQVGRLLDALAARADYDHTWIVVVADHGEGLGEHGEATHGVLLYDPTVHVPLIVRPPGGRAAVVSTPTSLVDLVPTLLTLAGLPASGLDGRNLVPQLRGDPPDPSESDRDVYAESLYAWHHYGWAPQRALIGGVDTLIDSTTPELYAAADRRQGADLAPADPARVAARRVRLEALYAGLAPAGTAHATDLSADQRAQLEALGYVTGDVPAPEGPLPAGLPDPRTHLASLGRVDAARQAVQRGDLTDARAQLEAVLVAEPGLADPQLLLAQVLLRLGELDAAEARLRALDAAHPGAGPRTLLGSLVLQRGRPAEAVEVLRSALETDPYLLSAWIPYLHALLAVSDPSFGAEVARARAALPTSTEIGGLAAFAAAIRGDVATAAPLVDAALAANPNQPLLHHARGLVLAAAGKPNEAEASFDEEVRLFPPAVASRRERVKIYADERRYEEQLAELAFLGTLQPGDPATLHSEAQALFNLGRYPEADRVVAECRSVAPTYAGCAMLEANVLDKMGRAAEAQRAYRRALGLAGQAPPGAPATAPPSP